MMHPWWCVKIHSCWIILMCFTERLCGEQQQQQQQQRRRQLSDPSPESRWLPMDLLDSPLTRIWSTSDLRAGITVPSYTQMRPFFKRLEEGMPVTVVAIGDSVIGDYGGCFHRDRSVGSYIITSYHIRTNYKDAVISCMYYVSCMEEGGYPIMCAAKDMGNRNVSS